jgi:hypothetical protein
MGLSYTIAARPRQRSHSQVWVLPDLWPHFMVSDSRLPQPGGPGSRIYIAQKQGWPGYTPRHWIPFSSLPTIRRATVEVFDPASTWAGCSNRDTVLDQTLLYKNKPKQARFPTWEGYCGWLLEGVVLAFRFSIINSWWKSYRKRFYVMSSGLYQWHGRRREGK